MTALCSLARSASCSFSRKVRIGFFVLGQSLGQSSFMLSSCLSNTYIVQEKQSGSAHLSAQVHCLSMHGHARPEGSLSSNSCLIVDSERHCSHQLRWMHAATILGRPHVHFLFNTLLTSPNRGIFSFLHSVSQSAMSILSCGRGSCALLNEKICK